ncbi:ankyrin repeat domain-containing protein [Pyramidobacter sp.]|uniref:ankyrin repeat domain-containing protein n=1 Tax=Pyramidobacter sp. TaxID=1943581 RepID=UPI0025EEA066|nr:ankyrin repeat domain-containing protein [Pyramidobacter sp.]MCI7404473.1 ankyrin repeat domain-containing protein [Pyramidobacter sp.]MDY3211809.1 ankyrin repeat domain-containing protein [Pyramidobacter sp.]
MKKVVKLVACAAAVLALCGSAGAADVNAVDEYGRTELMNAARYGELKKAEEQLKLGADVSICDTDWAGYNALHEAARDADAAMTELLLAYGADANAPTAGGSTEKGGVTALILAAQEEKGLPVAELLLKHGADPNAANAKGFRALHYAASKGNAALAELLLARGAEIDALTSDGRSPLIFAVGETDNLAVAKLLLDRGADVNLRPKETAHSPLTWALKNYNRPAALLLIERGADVNVDARGGTPLMWALLDGDEKLEIPKALLARGAKIGIVGDGGVTPFMIAAARENFTPETLQWLLDHGADPKGADKNGNSALYYAARSENAAARLLWLISLGLYDVNERDKDGASISALALGRAADPKLLAALLDAGADPKAASKDGYGLMHIAARKLCDAAKDQERTKEGADRAWNDALACFRLLCDKGVPLNERYGKNGETPLLVASGWGAPLKVVRTLVEAGADPKIAAADGKTALSLAESWSVPGVPEYLKSKM